MLFPHIWRPNKFKAIFSYKVCVDTDGERRNRSPNKTPRKMSLVDWENARLASSPREGSGRALPSLDLSQ